MQNRAMRCDLLRAYAELLLEEWREVQLRIRDIEGDRERLEELMLKDRHSRNLPRV